MRLAVAGLVLLLGAGCSAAVPAASGQQAPAHTVARVATGVSLAGPGLPTVASIGVWEKDTGTHPAMIEYYTGWGAQLDEAVVWAIHRAGAEPVIGIDTDKAPLSAVTAGQYDSWLKAYAASLGRLPFKVAVSVDHEFNGPWWPWSFNRQSAAQFTAAWRHIHDVFAAQKANVTWIWAANVTYPDTARLAPFWPGDGYVNLVGLDGYYTTPSSTFAAVFTPTIKQVRAFTGKPILITETGANPASGRPRAIANVFAGASAAGVAGLIWVDHDNPSAHGPPHNWLIDKDPAALAAFRAAAARYGG
jgi:hypothetical protein